jgi:hypothetical protein
MAVAMWLPTGETAVMAALLIGAVIATVCTGLLLVVLFVAISAVWPRK